MGRVKLNFWLAVGLALAGTGLAVSGFVRWLVLPCGGGYGYRGGRGGYAEPVFLLTRDAWDDVHKLCAVLFLGLVAAHIALHWDWLLCAARSLFRRR
ncbi:MAG: DUF4405 domain-containing protein [Bacillota bacterium]